MPVTTEPLETIPPDQVAPELTLRLKSVTVSGDELTFPDIGVTAIVGGNNVGKSTLLREIHEWLARHPGSPPAVDRHIVERLTLERTGDETALRNWLQQNSTFVTTQQEGFVRFASSGPLPAGDASYYWQRKTLGSLAAFFVHYSVALTRAAMVEPVAQRPDIADPPQHPVHVLQDNAHLLREIDTVSRTIFRRPLTLDRLSGQAFLRVGTPNADAPPIDAVTRDYRDALAKLPALKAQGDGMKSLLGLLLPVITATYPIVLIDEPEAFLHPPQALQLGKTLAALAQERNIQVVVATHDRNLLAGLLAAETSVSVVRLDREGDTTTAHQLSAAEVQALWTDAVMRYSNVLEGVFHRVVVVAEADPDCRFYAAAIDALDESETLPIPPSEILFIPSGGKDGMSKIVAALRAVSVRVVACPDLDLLDDEGKVRKLVEAFGGTWSQLKGDYEKAVQSLKAAPVQATCVQVLQQIQAVLEGVKDQPWTEDTRDLIKPATRTSQSEFKKLKRFGVATFSGQAAVHAKSLLDALDAMGICCIREGELERLAPTLGVAKGSAWLGAALDAEAHKGEKARKQVRRFLDAARV